MKVFISGGTGFVGHEVVRQLLEAGYDVRALAREGAQGKLAAAERLETVTGDVCRAETLKEAMAGCDAVIHLVGIIREFPSRGVTFVRQHVDATRNMLAAAREQGITRFLHMSANGTRKKAKTAYHRSKWQAEEAVRASDLDWTIFRPSLIYGKHDQFINMLSEQIRKLPVVPVLGNGRYRLSPVAVDDVARSFVLALENEKSIGEVFCCGGPDVVSYDQLLDEVAAALGRTQPTKLHHPLWLMQPMIRMLEGLSAFPVTSDQLTMLLEGNTCDPQPWSQFFELKPTPLQKGLREMLAVAGAT